MKPEIRPRDAAYFMDLVTLVAGALLALCAVVALTIILFSLEEVPTPARMPPAARELPFANPLSCDATMVVSAGGVITQRPGCYVRRGPMVWL